ncbi:uncharacterized protein LOC127427437 isoform X2 [Myxocyprinus asiaticus]|uniref:uncharacterized protein LOC127427437 isoform X2 n=1 Tax=Myxocyprinus asiaticus TaxID=70543 RepID=UPI002223DD46|nr:uncharacterized protein LOC127427437 isoform X2 [Myxocyprinus asiaticus]
MSNQEKRHTSHKTSMQHLRYLDSFMDEIDREVMSLTDRSFKSLCIGDEAIYNDSEFSPSPVSCHKPLVEEVSKKTQESLFSSVKKLNSYPLNGMNDALSRSNQSFKDLSLFAVFEAKKNGEDTKMTNGDSWDKSALLSIQKELSEFSADHHSLAAEHLSTVENHLKSAEKGSAKKSNKDASIPSEKSSKSKHSKNNKLRKLKSKNFFLHSEFSPFLSWGDFNKFSIGQENISEIMLSNRSPEWYDSPFYKELAAAHGHYKLSFPRSVGNIFEKCPKQIETHQSKPQLESVQSTPPSVPPKPKIETEHIIQYNIPSKASLLAAEQRCNSEKGETCVPWRKNRSRAKSALPVGHSLINLPVCKRSNPEEGSAPPFKKEVQTIEDQTSTTSTPFSISQLLTPVIPSRHGTGTSEILQAVLSPTALEFPQLPEREMYPLPEIKREGYKSIASNLLFNLKDNRKRVKTMYSPPKFKGLDTIGQSKESPLPKVLVSKDLHEIPDISEDKTISPACQKAIISPMSTLLEFTDAQICFPQGIANGSMPDDYLALSLLQSGSPFKSNRSPAANKAVYPSLQLYPKASPEEINIRANAQTVVDTSSCIFTDKDEEHSKHHNTESNNPSKLFKGVIKELPSKMNPLESVMDTENPTVSLYRESVLENKSGISPKVKETDEQAIYDGSQTKDKLKNKEVSKQKSPVKEKEPNRKEAGAKHVFSARQNNYIKSQRFVSTDIDDNDGDFSANKVLLAINDKNYNDEWCRHSKNPKTEEIKQEEHNTGIHKDKVLVQTKVGGPLLNESVNVRAEATTNKDQNSIISKSVLETQSEQQVKNEAFSMKGNISAKRALFASMEQVPNKTTVPLKKDNLIIDKFNLAKVALEEVIAEREQKKLKGKGQISIAGGSINDRNRVGYEKEQDGHELPINGEDQQTSMNMMSDKEKNTKDGNGLKSVSAFKTSGKTVGMMSEEVAKHGVSSLYIGEQERNTDNASKGDKVLGIQEKVLMNKNISHANEHTKRDDHLESGDIHSLGQYKEELGVKKKGNFYKPKVPPRRGISDCPSDDRVVKKTEGNKDLKRQGNTSVKTEEMVCKEVSKAQPSQSRNQGPVRGNVSALKKKYDKESGVHRKDVHKCLPVEGSEKSEEGPNELAAKDKIKHKTVIPKLTVSCPESETYSIIEKDMDSENERMSDSPSKVSEKGQEQSDSERKHDDTQDFQKVISDLTNNKQEIQDNKVNGTQDKEEGFVSLKESGDNQNKSKGHCKSYVKEFLNVLLGLSSSERVKSVGEDEEQLTEGTTLSFEFIKAETGTKDSITEHDILGQSQSFSTSNGKQTHHSSLSSNELSLLHKSEQGSQSNLEDFSSKTEVCDVKEKVDGKSEDFQRPKMDSCYFSNHESESDVSDRVVSPPSDVEKRGWVHCLIESAKNLTQISHSHNSPKDLHKMGQQLSQKDLDIFKDCMHSPGNTAVRSPQPFQPTMHLLSPPASQLTAVKDGKLSVGRISVSEEEERGSAVSTLFEEMDSCATSAGDTVEENISSTAPAEDAEGSKAPSERSGSVCSGNDSHGQNKPPVVPPKTEKALRRAMKLATRRIQKAEANSKSECKGRSTDKSGSQKAERRRHSTDKVHSDRLEHWSLSSDRLSSKHSEHYLDETLKSKTQSSDKNARHHSGHKSQNTEANDPSKTLQHATKSKDRQTSKTGDTKSHSTEKRQDHKSNYMDHFDNSKTNTDTDRLGRSNEKQSPRKLERRTQSLDRFLRDKLENKPKSTDKAGDEVNSELSVEALHLSTPKALPLRQNSTEHSYAPATTNIVTQSFPFTQRKLLQDPNSGQFFLVDMPVQVKTKTFFDPETKSYVQLRVQSPEAAVKQAQPLDVMNTPPLVLYHGFVPVPVSSLPSQKPIVRTAGSIIPPDDLEDITPNKKQMQDDFYQKHCKEITST